MSLQGNLILAKQQAHKAEGVIFYVNDKGVYQDYNLFGAKWVYKVYYKKGLYVEDIQGKKIEKPTKAKSASKLRNSTSKKVRKDDERTGSETSAD